ncbi:hypothetical protein BDR04DRAFT_1148869 [Suillus decipiens]|nr:hypothetical protein BDR04DRAFT_1148869 [Suillus decipiens]
MTKESSTVTFDPGTSATSHARPGSAILPGFAASPPLLVSAATLAFPESTARLFFLGSAASLCLPESADTLALPGSAGSISKPESPATVTSVTRPQLATRLEFGESGYKVPSEISSRSASVQEIGEGVSKFSWSAAGAFYAKPATHFCPIRRQPPSMPILGIQPES